MNHLCSLLFVVIICSVFAVASGKGGHIVKAKVESCSGCRLNRLPEVRAFIFEDLKQYPEVVFDSIPGHNPDLVFFNENNEEVERIDLGPYDRKQCNELLVEKGFEPVTSQSAESPHEDDDAGESSEEPRSRENDEL